MGNTITQANTITEANTITSVFFVHRAGRGVGVGITFSRSWIYMGIALWLDNESCFEAHLAKVEKPSMVSQRRKVEGGGNKTH